MLFMTPPLILGVALRLVSPAYRFADFLASARMGLWQVLPLGPLGFGNSPYSSTSAFAGNPLLIDLAVLFRTVPAVILGRGAY